MHVVGVALVKVYKAVIKTGVGAFSVPILMSTSEVSLSFLTVIKLLPHKSSEDSSLVPGPKAKSSSEITNPTLFTISYQKERQLGLTLGIQMLVAAIWGSPLHHPITRTLVLTGTILESCLRLVRVSTWTCPQAGQLPWDTDKFTMRPRNIHRWMDKEDVVHKNHGILFGHKKEWILPSVTWTGCRAKWNKPARERWILCELTRMWDLRNKQCTHKIKSKQTHKHREQERRGEDRNRSGRLTGMTFQVQRTGVRV